MKRQIAVCITTLALAGAFSAVAGEGQYKKEKGAGTGGAGMQVDMSRMGPWTRKPADESKIKKDVQAFIKEEQDMMKRGDFEASLMRHDFPIYIASDDSRGMVRAEMFDRQRFSQTVRPIYEQLQENVRFTSRPNITVLSDSLVVVTDETSLNMQGRKQTGKSVSLLVKKEGQWKWKALIEPGWAELAGPAVGGSGMGMSEEEQKQMEQQHQQMMDERQKQQQQQQDIQR